MNEGQEEAGSAVVTSGEAAELLEPVEAPLDDVSLAIKFSVVMSLVMAARMRRDHWLCTGRPDCSDQSAAVVATIGNDMGGVEAFDQSLGLRHVVGLARRDDQAERAASAIAGHMNFGAQTSSGAPQSLCGGPPFPVAAC